MNFQVLMQSTDSDAATCSIMHFHCMVKLENRSHNLFFHTLEADNCIYIIADLSYSFSRLVSMTVRTGELDWQKTYKFPCWLLSEDSHGSSQYLSCHLMPVLGAPAGLEFSKEDEGNPGAQMTLEA